MTRRIKIALALMTVVLLAVGTILYKATNGAPELVLSAFAQGRGPAPTVGGEPTMPRQVVRDEVPEVRLEVVARDLEIVWDIAFAPDGRLFFTERPGRIRVIPRSGGEPARYLDLGSVVHRGESGLMGIALHPDFSRSSYIYVMYTARKESGIVNRVSRFRDTGATAGNEEILFDDIRAAANHDGGALAFGPDGMLYTGDAARPPLAQDMQSPSGKILRLTPDGKIPADNPFPNSPVYASGFRNVTALSWHPQTRELWAASHGPSGEFPGLRARDVVYIVRKGGNHGWPLVVGTTEQQNIVSPVLYYPERSVPPGGSIFYSGRLFPQFRNNYFLATLRSQHLQRVVTENGKKITAIERWWPDKFGRLRAIAQAPDGSIYIGTSNRDGRTRGSYASSDFIYRMVPANGSPVGREVNLSSRTAAD